MNNLSRTSIILVLSIIYTVQLLADEKKDESQGSLKKASIEGYGHGWRRRRRPLRTQSPSIAKSGMGEVRLIVWDWAELTG